MFGMESEGGCFLCGGTEFNRLSTATSPIPKVLALREKGMKAQQLPKDGGGSRSVTFGRVVQVPEDHNTWITMLSPLRWITVACQGPLNGANTKMVWANLVGALQLQCPATFAQPTSMMRTC